MAYENEKKIIDFHIQALWILTLNFIETYENMIDTNALVNKNVNSTIEEKCEILNKVYSFGYIRPFWGVVDATFFNFQMVKKQKRTNVAFCYHLNFYSGQILVLASAVICVAKCGNFL